MADDRLYNLLPEYYRVTDDAAGGVLRALLQVISEQVDVVQADLDQLYRNWFIETCQDWAVPYIGDLVGYQPLSLGEATQSTTPEGQRLDRAIEGRTDVGETVANRRRKGTLAVLVDLALDVAGWPARAVEFRVLLDQTQSINHLRLSRAHTVDLRDGALLDGIGGAFDRLAHGAEIARVSSPLRAGRYDIPNVGLFVWRLGCYSITRAPAYCWDQARNQYSFSILGNDAPLITSPEPGHHADPAPLDVPAWISRRRFADNLADYYGPHASLGIWRDKPSGAPIPVTDVIPADLSDWTYRPPPGQVAVDPVLGRIAFPPGSTVSGGVWVAYHYGFSADMGGGEYLRPRRPIGGRRVYTVGTGGSFNSIMAAVDRWRADKETDSAVQDAVIEVLDGNIYQEAIDIPLDEGDHLELRAAPGTRPVIRLLDWHANKPDALLVRGTGQAVSQNAGKNAGGNGAGSKRANAKRAKRTAAEGESTEGGSAEDTSGTTPAGRLPLPKVSPDNGCIEYPRLAMPDFVLDGFLVTGRSMLVTGPISQVTIRHCTLVPGWSLESDCTAHRGEEPSIQLTETTAKLVVDHTITGSIAVTLDEPAGDPIEILAHDSIIDATSTSLPAVSGPEDRYAYARLRLRRCTVIGTVLIHDLELGDNTIFLGLIQAARRQEGCVRFCWVEPGSRTPARYECQPDLVQQAIHDEVERGSKVEPGKVPQSDEAADQARETERVRPRFGSLRYGTPTYCQLTQTCAPEITSGADDGSELGAFHDLFQPQRLANLNDRLQDYTPADMNSAVIIVT
jgi:hypothetical protein